MRLIPTKRQWTNWSLPSKLTAVGAAAGVAALIVSVAVAIVGSLRAPPDGQQLHAVLQPGSEDDPAIVQAILDNLPPRELIPDSWQVPESADEFKVVLGPNIGFMRSESLVLVRIDGRDLLTIHREPEGVITFDGDFFSDDGRIVAQVRANRFAVNPNNIFRLDRPTVWMLTVIDQKAETSLQVEYLNERTLRIAGTLRHPDGVGTVTITNEQIQLTGRRLNATIAASFVVLEGPFISATGGRFTIGGASIPVRVIEAERPGA